MSRRPWVSVRETYRNAGRDTPSARMGVQLTLASLLVLILYNNFLAGVRGLSLPVLVIVLDLVVLSTLLFLLDTLRAKRAGRSTFILVYVTVMFFLVLVTFVYAIATIELSDSAKIFLTDRYKSSRSLIPSIAVVGFGAASVYSSLLNSREQTFFSGTRQLDLFLCTRIVGGVCLAVSLTHLILLSTPIVLILYVELSLALLLIILLGWIAWKDYLFIEGAWFDKEIARYLEMTKKKGTNTTDRHSSSPGWCLPRR